MLRIASLVEVLKLGKVIEIQAENVVLAGFSKSPMLNQTHLIMLSVIDDLIILLEESLYAGTEVGIEPVWQLGRQ